MKAFWLNIIFLAISLVGITIGYTVQHEAVHKSIYEHYGIESEVIYHPFKGFTNGIFGETTAYYKEGQCEGECRLAHEENEIVGYNVQTVIGTLLLIYFLWFMTTETRRTEDGRD